MRGVRVHAKLPFNNIFFPHTQYVIDDKFFFKKSELR